MDSYKIAEDLRDELKDKSLDDLIQLIKAGRTCVNLQTEANPDGEIRGQIK